MYGLYPINFWTDVFLHAMPFTLTLTDWLIGGFQYEWSAYWYNLFTVLCYGALNFYVSVSTG